MLGVSPSSVSYWVRDIKLALEQRERNLRGPRGPQNPEHIAARMAAWAERARERRRESQSEGRERARDQDPVHRGGCMLYWAEGSKSRNAVCFANSDLNLVRLFLAFLRECFGIENERVTIRLNVYTGNGLSITQIEDHWLKALPYGVCQLRVLRGTSLIQHIYGAIQEYGEFDEPRWLDGPERKKAA